MPLAGPLEHCRWLLQLQTRSCLGLVLARSPRPRDRRREPLRSILALGVSLALLVMRLRASVAHLLSPELSSNVQLLQSLGTKLTPGQILGGTLKRRSLEDASTHIPYLGGFIKNAQNQSLDTFNTGTSSITASWPPSTSSLPEGMGAGHDAIQYAHKALSNYYDSTLPHIGLNIDEDLTNAIAGNPALKSANLPPTQQAQYNQILADAQGRAGPDGTMTGRQFQSADSQLRYDSQRFSKVGRSRSAGFGEMPLVG